MYRVQKIFFCTNSSSEVQIYMMWNREHVYNCTVSLTHSHATNYQEIYTRVCQVANELQTILHSSCVLKTKEAKEWRRVFYNAKKEKEKKNCISLIAIPIIYL